MANFKVTSLIAAGAISCLVCACSKPVTPAADQTVIKAELPQTESKVALDKPAGGSGLALRWEAGDKLTVIGDNVSVFKICDGFTDHSAEFSGTAVSGSRFTVYYPSDGYNTLEDILRRDYTLQRQNGNGSTEHLEWNAMLKDIADYTHMSFSQGKRSGVLEVSVMLPKEVATVKSLTVSSKTPVFYPNNDASQQKVSQLELQLENVDLSSDHTLHTYIMTSWEDMPLAAGEVITVTVVVDQTLKFTKRLTVPAGGLTLKSGAVNVIRLYGDAASSNLNSNLEGFIWTDDNFWN